MLLVTLYKAIRTVCIHLVSVTGVYDNSRHDTHVVRSPATGYYKKLLNVLPHSGTNSDSGGRCTCSSTFSAVICHIHVLFPSLVSFGVAHSLNRTIYINNIFFDWVRFAHASSAFQAIRGRLTAARTLFASHFVRFATHLI